MASDDGEVTKDEFLAYAKSSDFFKSQVGFRELTDERMGDKDRQ